MPAPESVKKLIETFGNNLDFYKSGQYNEAQLRKEFLDPFFKGHGQHRRIGASIPRCHPRSLIVLSAVEKPDNWDKVIVLSILTGDVILEF